MAVLPRGRLHDGHPGMDLIAPAGHPGMATMADGRAGGRLHRRRSVPGFQDKGRGGNGAAAAAAILLIPAWPRPITGQVVFLTSERGRSRLRCPPDRSGSSTPARLKKEDPPCRRAE